MLRKNEGNKGDNLNYHIVIKTIAHPSPLNMIQAVSTIFAVPQLFCASL
jgi:hypothetical protein